MNLDKFTSIQNDKKPKILKYFIITAGLLILAQIIAIMPIIVLKSNVLTGWIFTLLQMNLIIIPLYFIAKKHSLTTIEETFRIFGTKEISGNKVKYFLIAILGTAGIIILQNAIISLEFLLIPKSYEAKFIETFHSNIELYKSLFYTGVNWKLIFVILSGGMFPAIYEELLFRGYLQKNLEIARNPIFAILATSLLFTAFHPYIVGFLPLFVTAIYFGWLAYITNNIWLTMVAHSANNIFAVIILNFQDKFNFVDGYSYSIFETILLFTIATVILYYVYRFFINKKK